MKALFHLGEGWHDPVDEARIPGLIPDAPRSAPGFRERLRPALSSAVKGLSRLVNVRQGTPRHGVSLRALALLLRGNNHWSYNQALRLHRLLRKGSHGERDPFGMLEYLQHALPLTAKDFPLHSHRQVDQIYLKQDLAREPNILICFTGMAAQLNMPIPCFHSLACRHFDGIAYLFDHYRDFYISRERQVLLALHDLQELMPGCKFSALGTSGGGTIVLRLPESLPFGRRISASPPVMSDPALMAQLGAGRLKDISQARIFFAPSNALDRRNFLHLQHALPREFFNQSVFNLDWASRSHGTLATVMALGALPSQLAWLSGKPETEMAA